MTEQATTTTTSKQRSFNEEEQEIFNILIEYVNDMIKYRLLIFYIGTSCDNKRLRLRLNKLHFKLFKNITIHSDKMKKFFSNSLSEENISNTVERLFCFTLSTLTSFKSLIEKFVYLENQFNVIEGVY